MEPNDSGSDMSQRSEAVSGHDDNKSLTSNNSQSGSQKSQSGSQKSQSGSVADQDDPESRIPDTSTENPDPNAGADEVTSRDNIEKQSKSKNHFKLLRRLTLKTDKKGKDGENETENDGKSKLSKFDRILMEVKVDSLPQVFVTKYLGYKPCHGLWGIKHTQGPVEQLIAEVSSMDPEDGEDLPLVQLRVSLSGIHVREHSANTCKSRRIAKELIPIEFISYGVQDIRHTRIFSFILVREMSSKSRDLECHVYVCDSTANCRRLSLSVALAFKEYSKNLQGKPYKFQVDLRAGEQNPETGDEDVACGEDFEA